MKPRWDYKRCNLMGEDDGDGMLLNGSALMDDWETRAIYSLAVP